MGRFVVSGVGDIWSLLGTFRECDPSKAEDDLGNHGYSTQFFSSGKDKAKNCTHPFTRRGHFFAVLVFSFILLCAPGTVGADGPVEPAALPGGVNVTDSDLGAGEEWGRAGGRDIEYVVIDPSLFSALSWGNVNASMPGAAFDNSIDGVVLPGEILSFNPGGSNLGGGIAQWTGSAQITLVGLQAGVYTLSTRFTLTVTDHLAAPVSLATAAGEVDPGIDVKNDTNGTFNANLLFEAFYPVGIPAGSMIGAGNNTWMPLLDLFDVLDTGLGQDGFAHTFVDTGFYFTLDTGGTGLTLEQHDETVHTTLAGILSDTGFLRTEIIGRFINVEGALLVIDQLIRSLPTTQIPPNLATQGNVDDAASRLQESLTETLLIVLGILPVGGSVPDDIDFTKIPLSGVAEQDSVDALQAAVDLLVAEAAGPSSEVRVEVVEISDQSTPHYRQWLVKTTRDGSLVDAELTRLLAVQATAGELPSVDDVTALALATPLVTGLQEVYLELAPGRDDIRAYQFEVHLESDPPANGSALVEIPNPGRGR